MYICITCVKGSKIKKIKVDRTQGAGHTVTNKVTNPVVWIIPMLLLRTQANRLVMPVMGGRNALDGLLPPCHGRDGLFCLAGFVCFACHARD